MSVAKLLAQARQRLSAGTDVETVASLDVAGTTTRALETRPKVESYGFKLLFPGDLQWQAEPVVHLLVRGAYSRRLVDPERFGGTLVDRMIADEESRAVAARGMHAHLLRLSLTFLVRVPPGMAVTTEDRGVQQFARISGRTIRFDDPDQRVSVQLVLDPVTAQPLATVTRVRSQKTGETEDSISLLGDYRVVAGVRLPHRIDEWIGTYHGRVVLEKIGINTLKSVDELERRTFRP